MFDNKLVNRLILCRLGGRFFLFSFQDRRDRSFCEVERRFGGRQQRRLIDTDRLTAACAVQRETKLQVLPRR